LVDEHSTQMRAIERSVAGERGEVEVMNIGMHHLNIGQAATGDGLPRRRNGLGAAVDADDPSTRADDLSQVEQRADRSAPDICHPCARANPGDHAHLADVGRVPLGEGEEPGVLGAATLERVRWRKLIVDCHSGTLLALISLSDRYDRTRAEARRCR
jgi:hypothetical protein